MAMSINSTTAAAHCNRRIQNCPSSCNKTNVKEVKEMEQRASISIGEKPVPKAINLRSFFLTLFGKEIKKI